MHGFVVALKKTRRGILSLDATANKSWSIFYRDIVNTTDAFIKGLMEKVMHTGIFHRCLEASDSMLDCDFLSIQFYHC